MCFARRTWDILFLEESAHSPCRSQVFALPLEASALMEISDECALIPFPATKAQETTC